MNKNSMIETIIDLEWDLFQTVNGSVVNESQKQQREFQGMRKAQYQAWNDETLAAYLSDLNEAVSEGRNPLREKYINQMLFNDPDRYEQMMEEASFLTQEKFDLINEIWEHMKAQTIKIRNLFPIFSRSSRVLNTVDEKDGNASVETYQKGELLTYSEQTLNCFLKMLLEKEAKGVDLCREIQENSVLCMGYPSLAAAEAAAVQKAIEEQNAGNIEMPCCR